MRGKKSILYIFLCLMLFVASLGAMLYFGDTDTSLAVEHSEEDQNKDLPSGDGATENGAEEQTGAEAQTGADEQTGAEEQTGAKEQTVAKAQTGVKQGTITSETAFRELRAQNDRIVVLDAGCGGSQDGICVSIEKASGQQLVKEKDLMLALATACQKKLEAEGIFVVMTRDGDQDVTADNRVYAANAIPADFYISLHAFEDQDSSVYGMRAGFNDAFYMQGFDNEDLAYSLLENATEAANEKAIGVFPVQEDSELRLLMIPGVRLDVGCMTNLQQARLLQREDYRQKVAEGITRGVLEAYENMERKDR